MRSFTTQDNSALGAPQPSHSSSSIPALMSSSARVITHPWHTVRSSGSQASRVPFCGPKGIMCPQSVVERDRANFAM